jgi:predicted Ser/Thr protein kinase
MTKMEPNQELIHDKYIDHLPAYINDQTFQIFLH